MIGAVGDKNYTLYVTIVGDTIAIIYAHFQDILTITTTSKFLTSVTSKL
jgi:hypothetical protein